MIFIKVIFHVIAHMHRQIYDAVVWTLQSVQNNWHWVALEKHFQFVYFVFQECLSIFKNIRNYESKDKIFILV